MVAAYDDDFNTGKIKEMESRISKLEGDIHKAAMSSLEAPEKIRKTYYDILENLEAQKSDIELDLARLRIASGIKYTETQIVAWLKTFCNGEALDTEFQKRIIDVFINSVFVYDDKIVLYYNIKEGKQVSHIEMLEASQEPPEGGCPDTCNGVRISSGKLNHLGLEPRTL